MQGSTYKGLLRRLRPPSPVSLSYLTNFLFGILLNLEQAFDVSVLAAGRLQLRQSNAVFLCDISVVKATVVQELIVATITQLCHHLRNS